MELYEIAAALGIEKYPEALDAVYENLDQKKVNVCDYALLERVEAEYGIFGEFYDAVKRGMEDLQKDPVRLPWAETVATYIMDASPKESGSVPVAETDGSPAGDMLYMLVMLPLIPVSVGEYRRRGFSEEVIRGNLASYRGSMAIAAERIGRPGLDKLYYGWLLHYAKAMIFNYSGFNFELRKLPGTVMYLKNRTTGEVVPLLRKGSFHKNGRALGALGCEDPEGAREAEFRETEDAWWGLYGVGGLVAQGPAGFSKAEWECVLKPDDDVLAIHIPRAADLSDTAVERACEEGLALARQCYPELAPKCICCSSWLLDPALGDLVGCDSRIAKFGSRFIRFPNKSAGREVFNFVFRTKNFDAAALPENTRLERGLKNLYLAGGAIHSFTGVIL